jgi:hypothetical protein
VILMRTTSTALPLCCCKLALNEPDEHVAFEATP